MFCYLSNSIKLLKCIFSEIKLREEIYSLNNILKVSCSLLVLELLPGFNNMYTTAEEMVTALKNIQFQNSTHCEDSVLTAIAEAINSLALTNRSPVYVITDAVPDDEQEAETIFHINTYRGSPVGFRFK